MMMVDVDMESPSFPMQQAAERNVGNVQQQQQHNINTGTVTIDASHAGFSAMQYQSLKQTGNMYKEQLQNNHYNKLHYHFNHQ